MRLRQACDHPFLTLSRRNLDQENIEPANNNNNNGFNDIDEVQFEFFFFS